MTRLVASFVVLLALITSQGWAWRGSRGLRQTGAYWRTSLQSLPSNNDNMLSPSSKLLEGARRLREEAQRLETERDGIPVDVVKLNDFAKPNSPREHNESSLGSFVYRNNNSTYKIPTSKTDETSTKQTWTLNSQGYVVFSAEDLQTFLVPRGQESSQKEELLRKITRDFPSTPTKTPETVAKVSAPIVEAPNIAVVIPSRREAALPGMKSVNVKDLPLRVLLQHVPPEAIPDADSMVESLTMAYIYRKSVSFLIWCNIEAMSIDFEELSDVPIFKQIAKYFSTITFVEMINNDMKDMEAAAGIFRKDVSTAKLEELLRKLYREYYKTELIDIVDTLNEFQGVVVEEVVALPVKEEEVTSLSTSPAVEMEVVDEADNVQLLAVLKKVTDINERTLALVKEINELPKSEKTAPMYDMMVTTIEDNMAALKSIANMVANNSMSSTAGMSAMEESIAKMMSASSKLPTASNNKEDIKLNELVDMIIKMNSTAESFNNQYPKSLAEQLLRSYIEPDSLSRSTPLGNVSIPETISKAGVFAIQRALLSEIFDVRRVTRSYGAALYDGKIIETAADRDSLKNITSPQAKSRIRNERFVQEIEKRFKASGLGQSFDYFILENQQFPDISEEANGGDSLLSLLEGSGPALVVFPKSWVTIPSTTLSTGLPHAKAVQESNVLSKQSSSGLGKSIIFQAQTSPSILSQFSGDRLTRRRLYLPSVALATTLSFALQSSGLFDTITKSIESGQLPSSSAVPSYVLPMLLTSAGIPIVAALVEFVVGKMKQVNMDFTAFPSLTIFNFGLHSTWLNAPKNRSDAFDITISHVLTSLILSFALFWTGLDIMAKDIAEHSINPANYPVIPIPLLQANSLLQQLITIKIPTFFQDVVLSLQATSAATASSDGGAVSNIFSDQMIHIPWQMLVGMTSFIATTFNLLPSNDNQGNKLVFHSLGITGNLAAFVASSVVRFVITIIAIGAIFIPSFRSGNSDLNVIQIAIDYYFLSQFVGTEQDRQVPRESLTEIGDIRNLILLGLGSLLFLSFIPVTDLSNLVAAQTSSWSSTLFSAK